MSRPKQCQAEPVEVRLLGSFELRNGDGAPISLATRKTEALLAMLAMRPGEVFTREKLCEVLWPAVQDAEARQSLQYSLASARQALAMSGRPALRSDGRRVSLDPQHVRVDVARLEHAVARGTRDALGEATALWRGELFEGSTINAAPFQAWLVLERDRLRHAMIHALTRLTDLHVVADDLPAAVKSCEQLLLLDPWREEAHRTLMRLHVRRGRRASAVEHYQAFVRALRIDVHSEPEEETRRLCAEIEQSPAEAPATQSGAERRPYPPGPEPLAVGRTEELARLHRTLASSGAARATRATVALVWGDAGAGKTHLCERFTAEAETYGVRVLHTRAFEVEMALPFSLWTNLFADARVHEDAAALRRLAPELRLELAALIPELAGESVPRVARDVQRLFRAVRALLESLAESAPLVLFLDDLQWADEMSLRLVCALGQREPRQENAPPYFVLAGARTGAFARVPFVTEAFERLRQDRCLEHIELGPLSREDSRTLALQWAERLELGAPSSAWQERVWAISEGNPLVIAESVRASVYGALAQDIAALPLAERVRALLLRRMRGLRAEASELLSFAAVAGRELPLSLLQERRQGADQLFAELVGAQLMQAYGERYDLVHNRVREALYAELTPARRRWLHGQVANAIERHYAGQVEAVLGHLGYHYSKAGNAERSVDYLVRFAERTVERHGIAEALAVLEQALADSAQLSPARAARAGVDIVTRQAFCLAFQGRFGELTRRLTEQSGHSDALNEPQLAAPFHFWWGFALTVTGAREEAERHARRALAEASRCDDRRVVAYSHALLAYLCAVTGRSDEGLVHGETATRHLGASDDLPEALVLAWLNFGLNKLLTGDWRGALASSQRAREIAQAADSDRCRSLADTQIGFIFAYTERFERALERGQASLANAKEPFTVVLALLLIGWAKTGLEQTAEAIAMLEQLVAQLDRHGMRTFGVLARNMLAQSRLRRGELQEAERLADEALAIARETNDLMGRTRALRIHGRTALARGELDAARVCLDEALQASEPYGRRIDVACTLEAGAEVAIAAGDRELAQHKLESARALFAACHVDVAAKRVRARIAQI